jgi:hypothetical protein
VPAACVLVFALLAPSVRAEPVEPVTLLPVQDRLGEPEAVALVEAQLQAALGDVGSGTDLDRVRDHLRALRLRDPALLTEARLQTLAEEMGGRRFLVVSLLDLNREPVPRAILSGKLLRAGSPELEWAGFVAATGVDQTPWLGLGTVTDWRELLRGAVRGLVEDLAGPRMRAEGPKPLKDEPHAFRSEDLGPLVGRRVAIVPLDSLAESGPTLAAGAATDLVYASLHRRGSRLLLPGSVMEAMLEHRLSLTGAIRSDLRASIPADLFVTGAVDAWGFVAQGLDPQPEVGLALRVVDGSSGRILAMGSLFRNGWSRPGLFELGRIHGAGTLAGRITETLLNHLLPPSSGTSPTRTP